MKSSDIFPSKYLRAADLNGQEPILTIDRVEMELLGDERKPVVYFRGKERGLVMNKTNFTAIEEISGEEDTDNWAGTKVKLITAKVEFQGKRVPAIRVEPAPRNTGTAQRQPPPPPEPVQEINDDDIPF